MLIVSLPDLDDQNGNLNAEAMAQGAEQACDLLKAIATPNRLMLLCSLMNGEMTVGQLSEAVGSKQSLTSHHLNRLRLSGLVSSRRDEKFIYYRLADDVAKLIVGVLYEKYCAGSKIEGAEAA